MDFLDSNIINTAIPAIADSLKVGPVDVKIALISYLLSLATFIPISGWVADKYGAKSIFITAIGLFTLSSFWCGYADTLLELVIARGIQGVGGAFMASLGRLIIARSFARHELVHAMNQVIIVASVAVMLGPFIGGLITDYFSWPWIFWVNVPAGLFAMIVAYYALEDTAPRKTHPFDLIGFILFGTALGMFCFSLSEMSETEVQLASPLTMLGISILLFITYIFHAKRQPYPVIQTRLFRLRTFRISVLGNLCARLGYGGTPFLLPLMQQVALGFSAQLSGLLLVPMAFGIILSKSIIFPILQRLGYKKFLLLNTFCLGFALWSFQTITASSSVYMIAALTFIFGMFTASQNTAMNSLAFAEVNEEQLSAATSITSTTQVLAQSIGVALSAILLRIFSFYSTDHALLTVSVFHETFFSIGILTFLGTFVFISLQPKDGEQMLKRKR